MSEIQEKITITVALTLFFVIFITAFSFTQLFMVNNRNTNLYNLAEQNSKLTEFVSGSFTEPEEALAYLKDTDYLKKFEELQG